MPTTANKLLSVQTTGTNAGTWGGGASYALNEGCFEILDSNLGGVLTLTLSNIAVTLSATQARNCMIRLTGAMTGAVLITSTNIGFYMVENVTSGAYAVTLTNGATTITLEQSHRYLLFADSTNGVRIIANVDLTGTPASEFAAGTTTMFIQASAPTGWVASSSYNDRALRLVSAFTGNGGTVPFSTVFARQATDAHTLTLPETPAHDHGGITGNQNANHTHDGSGTTGNQNANHTHQANAVANRALSGFSGSGVGIYQPDAQSTITTGNENAAHQHAYAFTTGNESAAHQHVIGSAGGGSGHIHNIDLRVTYAEALVCVKS